MTKNSNSHESSSNTSFHYIDEFLKLDCAPTLLELKLFPNAKEITGLQPMTQHLLNP